MDEVAPLDGQAEETRVRKIAILDDYIGVALEYGDWSAMPDDAEIPGSCTRSRRCASPPDNPRREPSAVVPHAGICAGGRPQGRSLPRRSSAASGPRR
jgi:hypothetical protein